MQLDVVHDCGLPDLFPELYDHVMPRAREVFGYSFRWDMFRRSVVEKPMTDKEAHSAVAIALLFDELAVPVATALLWLRPRPWLMGLFVAEESEIDIHMLLDPMALPSAVLTHIESWFQPGVVNISNLFHETVDVKQWIALMKSIAEHVALLELREHSRNPEHTNLETELDYVVVEDATEERHWPKSLRPRSKKSRRQ